MADCTYTQLFEQIYKRAEEKLFEEIYETTNYDEVFESLLLDHFLLGREACKTAIKQYEIHKKKNILPFKGQTLSAYLDMVVNNQVYEDREAFLGISGLIPEEIQTKKNQYVDKVVQNILKQQN